MTDHSDLLQLVDQLGATADALARCSTTFPRPLASYILLEALAHTQERLAHVYEQLGRWHEDAADGTHYKSNGTTPSSPDRAQAALAQAAKHAKAAAESIRNACTANALTIWYGTVQTAQQSTPIKPCEPPNPPTRQSPPRLRAV